MSLRKTPPAELTFSPEIQNTTLLAQANCDGARFATPDPAYVLHVAPTAGGGFAFGASDDSLSLFDGELRRLGALPVASGLTGLAGGGDGAPLFATARDGSVTAWDVRAPAQPAFVLRGPRAAAYLGCAPSCDLGTLAAGTELVNYEATVDVWDLRQRTLRHTYTDSHSDDVSHVAFHPTEAPVLLSGGMDGLVNLYDTGIADEDDAVLGTSQIDASVAGIGWAAGAHARNAWASTTIETVQLWDMQENELLHDTGDVRDVCLEPWRTDYLIGAEWSATVESVMLYGGANGGSFGILKMDTPQHWTMLRGFDGQGQLDTRISGKGHWDIVRCVYMDEANSIVVSGGEDGQVCLWRF